MIDNAQIKTFFDKKSLTWDNSSEEAARKCQQIFEIPQIKASVHGAKVLDVGCGTGVTIPHMINAGAAEILGIDLSQKMVDIAKRKFAKFNLEKIEEKSASNLTNVNFKVANILDLNLQSSFDIVVMYNVYPHLAHKDSLVKQVSQLLKEGGRFVIAHGSSKETIDKIHASHTCNISEPILPASEEAQRWKQFFEIDTVIDNQQMYCVSGLK